MYVVTFYSCQGGTGRTTAIVNVAIDLAMRGRKVLLVDFDLGKPALSDFNPLCPDGPRPGVVEFVTEYLHLGEVPALQHYVYQAKVEDGTHGQVWVMPAGRADDNYWGALTRLDWKNLYAVREGFLFMEDLKAQWLDYLNPDYVLIDTPAGITATTATCTQQLADYVVLMVVSDQSDLRVMKRVMREVYKESNAEEPSRIEIRLVMSKVPDSDGEEPPRNAWHWPHLEIEEAGWEFDLSAILIPFAPDLLLEEQVLVTRHPGSRLARQYRELADALIRENCTQDRDGARAFLKELQLDPEQAVGTVDEGIPEEERRGNDSFLRLDQLIDRFTAKQDAEVLGQAASCLFLADNRNRAAYVLDEALELSPSDPTLLWQRASYRFKGGGNTGFVDDLMTLIALPSPQPSQPARTREEIVSLLKRRSEEQRLGNQLPEQNARLRSDLMPMKTVPGLDRYLVSAVWLLGKHAPEKLKEAWQSSRVQGLSEADRDRLFRDVLAGLPAINIDFLSEPERDRLLRAPLPAEQPLESMYTNQEPEELIRGMHFREVIAQLAPSVGETDEPGIAVHLAMAYWGDKQETAATQVSQQALTSWLRLGAQQLLDCFGTTAEDMVALQMFALLAFRAGNLNVADLIASRLWRDLSERLFQGWHFFSYWRYKTVTFRQFSEDCRELSYMIRQQRVNGTVRLPPVCASR